MKMLMIVTTMAAMLALPAAAAAAPQGGAASLAGGASINNPGVVFLPCTSGCPSFTWNATFTPKFAVGEAAGWSASGQLVAASCGGNVHTSTMSIGGKSVSYTGVCAGLLCVGGGPWGSGTFGAGLVFSVPFDQAAQCLNGIVGSGPGFTSASYNGGAAGVTN